MPKNVSLFCLVEIKSDIVLIFNLLSVWFDWKTAVVGIIDFRLKGVQTYSAWHTSRTRGRCQQHTHRMSVSSRSDVPTPATPAMTSPSGTEILCQFYMRWRVKLCNNTHCTCNDIAIRCWDNVSVLHEMTCQAVQITNISPAMTSPSGIEILCQFGMRWRVKQCNNNKHCTCKKNHWQWNHH